MKHHKKSRQIIILSGILLAVFLFGAIYLGAGVGTGAASPPNLYIAAEGETKAALRGSYGFAARVDMMTYNLAEIAKYRTPYVGDAGKVGQIAGSLPVPDSGFIQRYISMKTDNRPYGLTIYYEPAAAGKYEGEWPTTAANSVLETNSKLNALVVFCMIDNLDEVTFAFRNSPSEGKLEGTEYDTAFTFQRAYFAEQYGDLTALGEDLALTGRCFKQADIG